MRPRADTLRGRGSRGLAAGGRYTRPWRMRVSRGDGSVIAVEVAGDQGGRPVLVCHGRPGGRAVRRGVRGPAPRPRPQPDAHRAVWACFACQGMLAMSARSSVRGPAFGGHGPASQAAHRPAHGRLEIPSSPERWSGPSPVRGEPRNYASSPVPVPRPFRTRTAARPAGPGLVCSPLPISRPQHDAPARGSAAAGQPRNRRISNPPRQSALNAHGDSLACGIPRQLRHNTILSGEGATSK